MTEIRRVIVDGTAHAVLIERAHLTWIDGRRLSVDDVQHLPPVTPTKIVCVHLNYRSRLEELGRKPDECNFIETWSLNSNKCFAVFKP